MLTVSIFKLLLRQNRKQRNYNKCLLQERMLSIKRFKWNKRSLQERQLCLLNQLSKRRMMVMLRQSRKSKPRWLPLKQLWMQDSHRPINVLHKCLKNPPQCQILELSLTCTVLCPTWVK